MYKISCSCIHFLLGWYQLKFSCIQELYTFTLLSPQCVYSQSASFYIVCPKTHFYILTFRLKHNLCTPLQCCFILHLSICLYICLYQWDLCFHMLLYCFLVFFHFNLENSLKHFWKADLVMMSCLSFCLSGKDFLSPSFLGDCFVRYSILYWKGFFFQYFEYTISLFSGLQELCWEIHW